MTTINVSTNFAILKTDSQFIGVIIEGYIFGGKEDTAVK